MIGHTVPKIVDTDVRTRFIYCEFVECEIYVLLSDIWGKIYLGLS
jgi:hypothetical protein